MQGKSPSVPRQTWGKLVTASMSVQNIDVKSGDALISKVFYCSAGLPNEPGDARAWVMRITAFHGLLRSMLIWGS